MNKNQRIKSIRERAEEKLDEDTSRVEELAPHEIKAIIHDLRVHQIELEMQNEDLRNTQRQLEITRDRYAQLYNSAPVGYLSVDQNGIIIQANKTFAAMAGMNQDQIAGSALSEFIVPEDRTLFYLRFRAFLKNPDNKQLEFRLKNKERILWVRCTGRKDKALHPVSVKGQQFLLLAINDVSQQVLAENKLRQSEEQFRTLFMHSPFCIFIHDKNSGEIIDANPSAYTTYGYSSLEDLQNSSFWLGEPFSFDNALTMIHKAAHEGPQQFEWMNRKASGDLVWEHVRLTSITINGIERVMASCMDITEQKKAEKEIRQVNQQLERTNAEKDILFSIIAHDLRSPISGIFSTSEVLAQEAESMSLEDIRLLSAEMHKNSSNALELLNDLMQWARMNQEGMDFSPEKSSLYEMVRSSLHTAWDVAEKKDITIKCHIPQDLVVLVDRPMIKTVTRNLIFNAVKFARRGGNISITAIQTGFSTEVCISDDGIGMNEAILAKAFSVDKSKRQFGTEGEKGTGLGLILCKEFVEKHGGKIWMDSKPGQGTTVHFTVPSGGTGVC